MATLLFRLPPSGGSAIAETPAWLTDLLASHDGHEQRHQLRGRPLIGLEYEFAADAAARLQLHEALDLPDGTETWQMPLWPHRRRLTAPAGAGSGALAADLAWVPRMPQDGLYRFLLWGGSGPGEVVEATAMGDTGLTLASGPVMSWPAGAVLIPLLEGRLEGATSLQQINREARFGRARFISDLLDPAYYAPAPAAACYSEAGYRDHDVLTGLYQGRLWDGEALERNRTLLGGEPGIRSYDAQEPMGATLRTLHVICAGAAEIAALRAFLEARRGRAIPFWLPTWNADLTLTEDVAGGADEIYVASPAGTGYRERIFPLGAPRRHIQLWAPGHSPMYRTVSSADAWVGETAALGLTAPLTDDVTTDWLVSFLRFCRLDTDAVSLEWTGELVKATIPIREIPAEFPA